MEQKRRRMYRPGVDKVGMLGKWRGANLEEQCKCKNEVSILSVKGGMMVWR
jgi:hypothetical protein